MSSSLLGRDESMRSEEWGVESGWQQIQMDLGGYKWRVESGWQRIQVEDGVWMAADTSGEWCVDGMNRR